MTKRNLISGLRNVSATLMYATVISAHYARHQFEYQYHSQTIALSL